MVGPLKVKNILLIKLFDEKEFDQEFQKREVGGGVGGVGVPAELIADFEVADQAKWDIVLQQTVGKSGNIGSRSALCAWCCLMINGYTLIMDDVNQAGFF